MKRSSMCSTIQTARSPLQKKVRSCCNADGHGYLGIVYTCIRNIRLSTWSMSDVVPLGSPKVASVEGSAINDGSADDMIQHSTSQNPTACFAPDSMQSADTSTCHLGTWSSWACKIQAFGSLKVEGP